MNMKVNCKIIPDLIESLKENEVFIFGSNLSGYHGAGAAKLAFDKFGAIKLQGVGLMGNSYALPTKDKNIQTLYLKSLFILTIVVYQKNLLK